MRWTQRSDGIAIEAAEYSLVIPLQAPHIEVRLLQHHAFQLNIGSALDTVEGTDTWTAPGAPFVRRHRHDAVDIEWSAASERWPAKTIELRAMEGGFSYGYTVRGSADIEAAHFFRTRSAGSPFEFSELFNPEPNCQRVRLTGAHEPALISVGNRGEQYGGNWFYTPAPFCFAIRVGDRWLSMGIAAQPGRWMFDELVYAGDGFGLTLNYGGRERVDGEWVSPRVLCYLADTPYVALARYCAALRVEGLTSRRESKSAAAWWREPVFCGWGEQVALEAVQTVPAAAHATQRNYVRWLAHLESKDIHPGTVVVDDKWQSAYGLNEPDPERWPDLKGFIAEQHSAGRRVLLWLKAWDAEGVPSEECIRHGDGNPLAVDPGNAAYVRRLSDQVRRMLVSVGADGFKIDFTQSIPTQRDASRSRAGWGLELQRALLAIVSEAARDARPDVMLVAHAANPYLADLFDVLRLNDLPAWCDPDDDHDAVPEMRHRAAVARAAAPNWLLESDNWPFRGRRQWRDYLSAQATGELGIPSLYYAQHLNWGSRVEALDERDYVLIRQSWEQYRRSPGYVGRGRV